METNYYAIIGFSLSLLAICFCWNPIISLVCTITGLVLSCIGHKQENQKAFATAGIIISGIVIGIWGLLLLITLVAAIIGFSFI